MVKEERTICPNSSDRKTRTPTLTYLKKRPSFGRPHACFSAHLRTARWHAFLSLLRTTPFRSDKLTLCCSPVIPDMKVIGLSWSTMPFKIPWYAFHIVQRHTHTHLPLPFDRFAHKRTTNARRRIVRHFLLERKDVRCSCATHCTSCSASRHIFASARTWSIWLSCQINTLYMMAQANFVHLRQRSATLISRTVNR